MVLDAETKRKPITSRAQGIQKKGSLKHPSIAHFVKLKDTPWKSVEKRKNWSQNHQKKRNFRSFNGSRKDRK
jgi:hypothetical protein